MLMRLGTGAATVWALGRQRLHLVGRRSLCCLFTSTALAVICCACIDFTVFAIGFVLHLVLCFTLEATLGVYKQFLLHCID